jgi:tetratricopeptide (TPR) repeat protein
MRESRLRTQTNMLRLLFYSGFLLATTLSGVSQTSSLKIDGVPEPPELSGPPKAVVMPTAADRQMVDVYEHLKDEKETQANLPILDKLIQDHPDYVDAYSFRAQERACVLTPPDLHKAKADLEAAMSLKGGSLFDQKDQLSLLGKIKFANGGYGDALDDLERAIKVNLDNADKIFNVEGATPERTSKFCSWNLADLDLLIAKFPRDWRPLALRGLYYEYFTRFKEDYYANVAADLQKAVLVGPKSPLPIYLVGELHTRQSFWTQKAWASDAGRDEATRASLLPFTKAIELDPKFLPAYLARAEAYLNLKQSAFAIRDFDKVLALDPEKTAAYSDRGLAKMDVGRYYDAISDFGEAIRRKAEGDIYIPNLYENRGDAYVKVKDYRSAIPDYSMAIEKQLERQIILLSLAQFRALYPEYESISDDTLLQKLYALFRPGYEYAVFVEQLTKENGKWEVSSLDGLYEKRGDAYLKIGDYKRAVLDFQRIFVGMPNFANFTERWRTLGSSAHGENYFLDAKSSEVSPAHPIRLWVKMAGAKHSQVMAFGFNCSTRQVSLKSSVAYDSNGAISDSSDLASGWSDIVPDSIGEQLWNGVCLGVL